MSLNTVLKTMVTLFFLPLTWAVTCKPDSGLSLLAPGTKWKRQKRGSGRQGREKNVPTLCQVVAKYFEHTSYLIITT